MLSNIFSSLWTHETKQGNSWNDNNEKSFWHFHHCPWFSSLSVMEISSIWRHFRVSDDTCIQANTACYDAQLPDFKIALLWNQIKLQRFDIFLYNVSHNNNCNELGFMGKAAPINARKCCKLIMAVHHTWRVKLALQPTYISLIACLTNRLTGYSCSRWMN